MKVATGLDILDGFGAMGESKTLRTAARNKVTAGRIVVVCVQQQR